ncbi:MAG: aldehyde dehydrogenase, partial [Verrucomicrobia bacterium]|nr:aldehyde dehydrogenase [Verrucomicrobiota bacterium]
MTTDAIQLPVLRWGQPYTSLQTVAITHCQSDQLLARVSQANAALIRRDLSRANPASDPLRPYTTTDLLDICRRAAGHFMADNLPIGAAGRQTPDDYTRTLSASSGLPLTLCRDNMTKLHNVLTNMPHILAGLTRSLDLTILDAGWGLERGIRIQMLPTAAFLGAVLLNNSPGVNGLWLPAIALKIPVVLKPGKDDPWTPWRLIQALIAAGAPASAFGFYPADHDGAQAVLD